MAKISRHDNTNKAFIFDMDGVLIDSEIIWEHYESHFWTEWLGKEKYFKIKNQMFGNSMSSNYQLALQQGLKISKKEYLDTYDEYAKIVYSEAQITPDIAKLIKNLVRLKFQLGLVSSSRLSWINIVLEKLKLRNKFKAVISLVDKQGMRPKPFPDGYVESMRILGSLPATTVILEDSNSGIKAAKTSGALTVCLKENLPRNYKPEGADLYIESIAELVDWLEGLSQSQLPFTV